MVPEISVNGSVKLGGKLAWIHFSMLEVNNCRI
jgi:hypothetical protein